MSEKKPRTVIVDDDSSIRGMLKLLLSIVNFEVVGEASNGDEAVSLIKETSPDFVLLDINMPVKQGDEVLEEVKDMLDDMCVVMISQISEIDVVKKCVDNGAFYYIKKDGPFPQMVKNIESVWKKYYRAKNQPISILPSETPKEYAYRKIIEDKFLYMLLSRGYLERAEWDKLLETKGSAYGNLLSLAQNSQIKEDLGWLWAASCGCSFINPNKVSLRDNLIKKMPFEIAEKYGIIPLYEIEKSICVAFSRLLSEQEKTNISQILWNREIDYLFSFPDDIQEAFSRYYLYR
jgi:DNA-binding NarL/FixJ family response regulator